MPRCAPGPRRARARHSDAGALDAAGRPPQRASSLPSDHTIELWQTPGFGQACDGCGQAITTTDSMYLICADDWRAMRLHEDCFVVWEEEKRTAA